MEFYDSVGKTGCIGGSLPFLGEVSYGEEEFLEFCIFYLFDLLLINRSRVSSEVSVLLSDVSVSRLISIFRTGTGLCILDLQLVGLLKSLVDFF